MVIYIKFILKLILKCVYKSVAPMVSVINMKSKIRVLVTLSPYLKEKLVTLSEKFGCSQAEVVRTAILKLWEGEK